MERRHETPARSGRGILPALSISLLLGGVAPFVAYQVLSRLGVSPVAALTATAAFPTAGVVLGWVRARRLDGIGLLSLVVIAIGLAATLLSGDPRLYLVRGAFGTGAFGAVCVVSLAVRRPLMFYLGRQLSSGDDRNRQAAYDQHWSSAAFRRRIRILTLTWGIAYLAEAAARVLVVGALPPSLARIASPLLGYGVAGLLVLWSMAYAGAEMGCGHIPIRGVDAR